MASRPSSTTGASAGASSEPSSPSPSPTPSPSLSQPPSTSETHSQAPPSQPEAAGAPLVLEHPASPVGTESPLSLSAATPPPAASEAGNTTPTPTPPPSTTPTPDPATGIQLAALPPPRHQLRRGSGASGSSASLHLPSIQIQAASRPASPPVHAYPAARLPAADSFSSAQLHSLHPSSAAPASPTAPDNAERSPPHGLEQRFSQLSLELPSPLPASPPVDDTASSSPSSRASGVFSALSASTASLRVGSSMRSSPASSMPSRPSFASSIVSLSSTESLNLPAVGFAPPPAALGKLAKPSRDRPADDQQQQSQSSQPPQQPQQQQAAQPSEPHHLRQHSSAVPRTSSPLPSALDAGERGVSPRSSRDAPGTHSPPLAMKMLVSNNVAGAILGRGGTAIRRLEADSGAQIRLSQVGVHFPGTVERIVLVQGAAPSITTAVTRIGLISDHESTLSAQALDALAATAGQPRPELELARYLEQQHQQLLQQRLMHSGADSDVEPSSPLSPLAASTGADLLDMASDPAATPRSSITQPASASHLHAEMLRRQRIGSGGVGGDSSSGGGAHLPHAGKHLPPGATPHPHVGVVRLLLSDNACGFLIGRRGVTVRQIQDASGADIQLSPKASDLVLAGGRDLDERIVTITGLLPCVCNALALIVDTLAANPAVATYANLSTSGYDLDLDASAGLRPPAAYQLPQHSSAPPSAHHAHRHGGHHHRQFPPGQTPAASGPHRGGAAPKRHHHQQQHHHQAPLSPQQRSMAHQHPLAHSSHAAPLPRHYYPAHHPLAYAGAEAGRGGSVRAHLPPSVPATAAPYMLIPGSEFPQYPVPYSPFALSPYEHALPPQHEAHQQHQQLYWSMAADPSLFVAPPSPFPHQHAVAMPLHAHGPLLPGAPGQAMYPMVAEGGMPFPMAPSPYGVAPGAPYGAMGAEYMFASTIPSSAAQAPVSAAGISEAQLLHHYQQQQQQQQQ